MAKIREYISSRGGFRFVTLKYYFDVSGRSSIFDVLVDSYLDTTISDRWPSQFQLSAERSGKRKVIIV